MFHQISQHERGEFGRSASFSHEIFIFRQFSDISTSFFVQKLERITKAESFISFIPHGLHRMNVDLGVLNEMFLEIESKLTTKSGREFHFGGFFGKFLAKNKEETRVDVNR